MLGYEVEERRNKVSFTEIEKVGRLEKYLKPLDNKIHMCPTYLILGSLT